MNRVCFSLSLQGLACRAMKDRTDLVNNSSPVVAVRQSVVPKCHLLLYAICALLMALLGFSVLVSPPGNGPNALSPLALLSSGFSLVDLDSDTRQQVAVETLWKHSGECTTCCAFSPLFFE